MSRGELLCTGLLIEYASVAWMIVECVVSIGVGFLAGSLALLAFGGDSFIELISSYTVAAYIRRSLANPTGDRRELGAERVEWISALLLALLVPVIALGGIYSYFIGREPESSLAGISIAAGAVVIMPALWFEKRRLGIAADCLPLSIDAAESATCFLMSVALLGGLLINYFLNLWWVDYAATAIILVFVAKEAMESIREVRKRNG